MSDPAATTQRQQATQRSVAKTALTLPFRLFGVLCGSLLVSIIMEWIGMHFFWVEQGWRHAEAMVQYELNQLSSHFTHSLIVQEPGRSAVQLVEVVHEWLLVKSGVQSWARNTAEQAHAVNVSLSRLAHGDTGLFWVQLKNHLLAAAYATLVFLVRLVVITLTLPLVFMAAFVGLIDGLVRRDVRRFGAGRESGFIYHRARAALMPLLVLPWVLYLALPVSISPLLILLPGAAVLGIAVCIVAAKFKKYL